MTVAELIEGLRLMPQDATVIVPAMFGDAYENVERLVTADSVKCYRAKLCDAGDGPCWMSQADRVYVDLESTEHDVVEIR